MAVTVEQFAQYSLAGLAFALVAFMVGKLMELKKVSETESLAQIVNNNTAALVEISQVLKCVQLSVTKQEAKLDELLERARKG